LGWVPPVREFCKRVGLCLVVAVSGIAPAEAVAALTIGSNLGRSPTSGACGFGQCTFFQMGLPATSQAGGGVFSPVNGTVTRWRIGSGPVTAPTALRIIRRASVPGFFTADGTSDSVTPPPNSIATFPTSLPIRIGDGIGIDCCSSAQGDYLAAFDSATGIFFPALGNGESDEPFVDSRELALNADIEPTSTFRLTGAEPVGGGAVKIVVSTSNPGTITVSGKGPKVAVKRKPTRKRKVRYLKHTTFPPYSFAPLVVQPTNAALRVLRHLKRPRVRVKVVFTPLGGAASAPAFDSVRLSSCPACPPDLKGRG
jgi:hypothetical protein